MSGRDPYIILATDRVAVGFHAVTPERAEELTARYAPTALLPDAWTQHPVARINRGTP